MQTRLPVLFGIAASLCLVASAVGQSPQLAHPQARLIQRMDESTTVTLQGNVHPLARAALAASQPVDGSTPMQHMILHLKGDAAQEAQLAQLIAQQKDPKSPLYHHYLTPDDFGAQFGVADSDLAQVTDWLESHGFTIDRIPASKKAVVFSGTASQVASAFNTEIRSFTVAGERHIANTVDPQIPVALADVVAGIVQLHDFQSGHRITHMTPLSKAQLANPQYTDSTGHYLAPPDFSIIYNTNPLYASGIDGTGQSIAVVARSNIEISDITKFRTMFGLPPNDPQIILVTTDPGLTGGNATETTLDTEWAGAIAPKATIKVIVGQCTNTADGVADAELYAVNHNIAPIVSISYGQCEATMGSSQMAFYNALWQQAAAQGQSIIVSSGDTGAAGCNSQGDTTASIAGINGLCSSPYSTCVGGTQFVEGTNPGQYWLPGNNSSNGSAIGYIPETVWNESGVNGGSGLTAGGGGASIVFAKPSWQAGIGVPADGKRDVPDVSLSAAQHDGYLVYENWAGDGGLFSAGGTSFSAPAFAAIIALVNQKTGNPQGLINPTLYALAAKQAAGGAAVFHDITTGNISVPGLTGASANAGYDLASGLGSVNAALLVNHWTEGVAGITLTAASGTLSVTDGQTVRLPLTVVTTPTLNSAVTFSVSGAPANVTATFAPSTLPAPGSGSTTLSLATSLTTVTGSYKITVTATGGGQTATLVIPVNVGAPTFLLLTDKTQLSLAAGVSSKVNVTTTAQTGFSSALALTLSGAPAGVTAVLSAKSVAAPGTGALTLSVANASATPGNYFLTITGTGGGRTVTNVVALTIPTFAVTSPASYYTATAGGNVTIPVTVTPQAGFTAPIAMSAPNYLPSGVGIAFSPASVSGTAPSSTNLTLSVGKTISNGAYPFFINGTGGGITQGDYVYLLVGIKQYCTLWVYDSSMAGFTINVTAGQSNTGDAVCLWPQGAFNGPLSVYFNNVPAGLSVQSTQPLLAGGTTSAIQVTAAQSMAAGTYHFNMVGTQGTFTTSYAVTVAVTANSFSLASAQNAVSIPAGATAPLTITTNHNGIFKSAVALAWSGLPTGVTAALSKSSFPAPGDGSAITTFSAAANAKPGTYTATLTATGNSQTQTIPVNLTVTPASCRLGVTYLSGSTLSLFAGQTGSVQVACSSQVGVFSAPISLAVTGAPAGVTASAPSSMAISSPNAAIQISTPQSLGAANIVLSLTAASGSFTQTIPISVTVAASNFTVSAASSALTISQSTAASLAFSSTHQGLFNSPIAFSWAGLPAGVTVAMSKSSVAAPGDGAMTTTFTVAANAAAGTYTPSLTTAGGGLTQTLPIKLTVAPPPSCTVAVTYPASASSLIVTAGSTASALVSCNSPQGVFSGPIALTLSGAPAGVTATATATTMTAGGNVSVQVSPAATMSSATFNLSLALKSGTFTATLPLAVTVNANRFTLTQAAQASATSIKVGATGQVTVTIAHLGVFNSALTLSWTLPAGVTATYSKSVAAPGDATLVTTFSVAASAKTGSYTATLVATGGGQTQSLAVPLTIASK